MKNLRTGGYIEMGRDGLITLTEPGREIAERIYERHRLLTRWLVAAGVDPDLAAQDACRIEHDLSPETFEVIKRYIGKYGEE